MDPSNDLTVENAAGKHVFMYDDEDRVQALAEEMDRLGISCRAIGSMDEYIPTGKKDYLFFEEKKYDDKIRDLLDRHKELTGIVLVDYGSVFVSDKQNLHTLERPGTSMTMVDILNGRYNEKRQPEESKAFKIDFTAPDARFLIVDDNEINLTIAGGLIAPLKAHVESVGGGQAAVDKALANDYDIIFMDHMMPVLDGVGATKAIRAADIKQPVIVALSANAMEEARRLFEECGMNDFVAKPIDVRALISVIKKWLPPEKIVESDGVDAEPEDGALKIDIEGLDLEKAIRALGSAALYDKIAGEYYRSGDDKLNAIVKAFNEKDWTDYTIRVHALKSSSRQIGAMELGDMAEALEKAGKANDLDTIMADTDRTMKVYRDLLDKLAVYYDEGEEADDTDKPMMDKDTLAAILDELETACNDLDMDGMEDVDNRLKGFAYEAGAAEVVSALHKAISELDTEGCMDCIGKLRDL
jgi:CheY-like chemotaxis protein/HPt (histidine-containing phosphotransfer) domain-containing protein